MTKKEMEFYYGLLAILLISQSAWSDSYNITCYYDTFSIERGGYANFTELYLKTSLQYCSHIVYGYVGLKSGTFEIETLHSRQQQQFSQIKNFKNQYRHIKFFLSVGGDKDLKNPEKYMKLLEPNGNYQESFISSARKFLRKYKFDGLDLAYQFPKTKSKLRVQKMLKEAKGLLKNNPISQKFVNSKNSKKISANTQKIIQKQQFTLLLSKLREAFKKDNLMLTLTVLPNVNASQYLNIPAIIGDLDFVNLGTFDYSTPQRTPHEADYLAPLQAPPRSKKNLLQSNVDSTVRQWLSQHIDSKKLNIGIATYGRTWKMTKELSSATMPVTAAVSGPASGGELTHTQGLLSWTEFCSRLDKMSITKDKKYGNYAYRSANIKGNEGLFLTFEDKESLEEKAEYVMKNSLGGIAIFDLTLDDFRGKCNGGKFPALKAIKFKLH